MEHEASDKATEEFYSSVALLHLSFSPREHNKPYIIYTPYLTHYEDKYTVNMNESGPYSREEAIKFLSGYNCIGNIEILSEDYSSQEDNYKATNGTFRWFTTYNVIISSNMFKNYNPHYIDTLGSNYAILRNNTLSPLTSFSSIISSKTKALLPYNARYNSLSPVFEHDSVSFVQRSSGENFLEDFDYFVIFHNSSNITDYVAFKDHLVRLYNGHPTLSVSVISINNTSRMDKILKSFAINLRRPTKIITRISIGKIDLKIHNPRIIFINKPSFNNLLKFIITLFTSKNTSAREMNLIYNGLYNTNDTDINLYIKEIIKNRIVPLKIILNRFLSQKNHKYYSVNNNDYIFLPNLRMIYYLIEKYNIKISPKRDSTQTFNIDIFNLLESINQKRIIRIIDILHKKYAIQYDETIEVSCSEIKKVKN